MAEDPRHRPGDLPRPSLRVSDAERHQVVEVLREAAGEGRLDLTELEERLELAFAAKTYADLEPLVRDLPAAGAQASLSRGPAGPVDHEGPTLSIGIMSGPARRGAWSLPPSHTALAVMGSVHLDLREAALPPEATITAVAVMGGITVVVDPHTRVVVDGVGLMGDFSEGRSLVRAETGPGSPVVRVRGLAFWGGVSVVRKQRRSLEPPRGRGEISG